MRTLGTCLGLIAFALACDGCGGANPSIVGHTRSITVSPSRLTFTGLGLGYALTVLVSEPGYGGGITPVPGSCDGIVSLTPLDRSYYVEPVHAGKCTLWFEDDAGNVGSAAVSVT
jgi:hypothetical protein